MSYIGNMTDNKQKFTSLFNDLMDLSQSRRNITNEELIHFDGFSFWVKFSQHWVTGKYAWHLIDVKELSKKEKTVYFYEHKIKRNCIKKLTQQIVNLTKTYETTKPI